MSLSRLSFLLFLVLLEGCGPEQEPAPPLLLPGDTSPLDDQSNFSYSSDLSASIQTLSEYQDILIQWGGLKKDVHDHSINPVKDIDTVTLLIFPRLKPQEALVGLANDRIEQADIGLYMVCTSTNASCKLSKFGLLGSFPGIPNYYNEGRGSWLFMLANSKAKHSMAFAFINPSSKTSATTATITDSTSALKMNVDLRSLVRLRVRKDGDTRVDWSKLTRDGLGNKISQHNLDLLTVTHYKALTLEQLEQNLIDIEKLADQTWETKFTGFSSVSLRDLKDTKRGSTFAGFSDPGIYLLGIQCTTCINPAPKALTVLSVE